jgi:hypothetical protein
MPLVDVVGNGDNATPEQIAATGLNIGTAAGRTVIILDVVIVLPQASVNVQVSVISPPPGPGEGVCDDTIVPLIKHVPVWPLV